MKKGVHFGLKSQCFIEKKGSFRAEKSVFLHEKGGHFQTGEQGWVPLFPVSEEIIRNSSYVSTIYQTIVWSFLIKSDVQTRAHLCVLYQ